MINTEKKILLISAFVNPNENNSSRVNKIYDLLDDNSAIIITTNFNHGAKEYYPKNESSGRHAIKIDVPAYKNNISFKRFFSHIVFAYRIYKYLMNLKETPGVVYISMPTSTAAFVCGLYCRKKGVNLVVDVIDIWPESLIALYPFKRIAELLTFPWKWISTKAYKSADYLFAESIEYAKYVQKYNSKVRVETVYLGTDVKKFYSLIEDSKVSLDKKNDETIICYGGSLGNSYDFDVILETLLRFKQENKHKFQFVFIGGGEKQDSILEFVENNNLSVKLTGRVPYKDYLKYLSLCDIGINSFKQETKVVHSYKYNDYISAGLVVVNNLKGETFNQIEKYKIGFNFDYNKNTLYSVLTKLLNDRELVNEIKCNTKYVAKHILSSEREYSKMIKCLKQK